jgi:iron(III) transport system ATP-binding protein
VAIGSARARALHAVEPGPVKVAIRPEAWTLGAPGNGGLQGTVSKQAYLGSFQELTVDTSLGAIFVVSSDVKRQWQVGDALSLQLPQRGVSVVRA